MRLSGAAPSRILVEFLWNARVPVRPRSRKAQHPGHVAPAEEGIAQHYVVHVSPLRNETSVLDVSHDLDLVHAISGAGSTDDVFLDHHAAHVVGAVRKTQLADLPPLRDP